VGLAPTGKRRLFTAHAESGRWLHWATVWSFKSGIWHGRKFTLIQARRTP
jgi:hypothetical protein